MIADKVGSWPHSGPIIARLHLAGSSIGLLDERIISQGSFCLHILHGILNFEHLGICESMKLLKLCPRNTQGCPLLWKKETCYFRRTKEHLHELIGSYERNTNGTLWHIT